MNYLEFDLGKEIIMTLKTDNQTDQTHRGGARKEVQEIREPKTKTHNKQSKQDIPNPENMTFLAVVF